MGLWEPVSESPNDPALSPLGRQLLRYVLGCQHNPVCHVACVRDVTPLWHTLGWKYIQTCGN